MIKTMLTLMSMVLLLTTIEGQANDVSKRIGLELQAYPTGIIPGIRAEWSISERSIIDLRIGYQIVRHGDAGFHDNERGDGIGGSVGYLFRLGSGDSGWLAGARCDLWYNTIDWEDGEGNLAASGVTDVTVVQPTLRAGYRFRSASGKTTVTPMLAFGVEINIRTDGAPVGQGPIILAGVDIGFRL